MRISDLQKANAARQDEWCPDQKPDLSFRGNEMAGEAGEACNVIKKLERERHGWRGSRATLDMLADELADVVITASLTAVTAGIDLENAVIRKFSATSEKNGLSTRLLDTAPPAVAVKALEWENPSKDTNGCYVSKTVFGTYSAVNEGGWHVMLDDHPRSQGFEWSAPDMRMTFADAKAAAQADYEARIRPALVSPADTSPIPYARGLADALAERMRQREVEGWTADHDDTHSRGELARAAACYALQAAQRSDETPYNDVSGRRRWRRVSLAIKRFWPWGWGWWKPRDARHDLIRAAALIIAEIERLDRAEAREPFAWCVAAAQGDADHG